MPCNAISPCHAQTGAKAAGLGVGASERSAVMKLMVLSEEMSGFNVEDDKMLEVCSVLEGSGFMGREAERMEAVVLPGGELVREG